MLYGKCFLHLYFAVDKSDASGIEIIIQKIKVNTSFIGTWKSTGFTFTDLHNSAKIMYRKMTKVYVKRGANLEIYQASFEGTCKLCRLVRVNVSHLKHNNRTFDSIIPAVKTFSTILKRKAEKVLN